MFPYDVSFLRKSCLTKMKEMNLIPGWIKNNIFFDQGHVFTKMECILDEFSISTFSNIV